MQSGVQLGFENMHQLLCYMTLFYFLHFFFKTFSSLQRTYLFPQLALIIFEFSNELHLTPFLIKRYEIKIFKAIS